MCIYKQSQRFTATRVGKEVELCHYCKHFQKRFCEMCIFLKVCQSHPKSCFLFSCRIVTEIGDPEIGMEVWKTAISFFCLLVIVFLRIFMYRKYLQLKVCQMQFNLCCFFFQALEVSWSPGQVKIYLNKWSLLEMRNIYQRKR